MLDWRLKHAIFNCSDNLGTEQCFDSIVWVVEGHSALKFISKVQMFAFGRLSLTGFTCKTSVKSVWCVCVCVFKYSMDTETLVSLLIVYS